MTFLPSTKWRLRKGFRASTTTEVHATWRNSALRGLLFSTVPLRATLLAGRAVLIVFLVADFFRAVAFSFFFFIRSLNKRYYKPLYRPPSTRMVWPVI